MPLNIRSIAVSVAVVSFFVIAVIGWISGLSPFTCCRRAIAVAVIAYIAAAWAVKAINAILTNAMIKSHINTQKEQNSAGGN